MDNRNVRVLRYYDDSAKEDTIYIDDSARHSLGNLEWGSKVLCKGRRKVECFIQEIKDHDADAQIARMNVTLRDKAMIEWGEEVLLDHLS
jgi:hypothetical protein